MADLLWIVTATLQVCPYVFSYGIVTLYTNPTNLNSFVWQLYRGETNKGSCIIVIFLHYFHLTNFFWMFVEGKRALYSLSRTYYTWPLFPVIPDIAGFYLYMLVVETFSADKIRLRIYAFIGWGKMKCLSFIHVLFCGCFVRLKAHTRRERKIHQGNGKSKGHPIWPSLHSPLILLDFFFESAFLIHLQSESIGGCINIISPLVTTRPLVPFFRRSNVFHHGVVLYLRSEQCIHVYMLTHVRITLFFWLTIRW
jgi:hypothetical protein